MSDMDTTAFDGRSCWLCGDDAVTMAMVGAECLALCAGCYDNQTDSCDGEHCGHARHLMTALERVPGRSGLFCALDAASIQGVTEGRYRELVADMRGHK